MKDYVRRFLRPRAFGAAVASIAFLIAATVVPASAEELISVDNDGFFVAEPGSRTRVAEVQVQASEVGRACTLTVLTLNGASVHAGNDLIIITGGVEAVIPNVEAEPDASTNLSVDFILGETIAVELLMGPDWVSSLGFDLSLDCGIAAPVLTGPTDCSTPSNPLPPPGSGGPESTTTTTAAAPTTSPGTETSTTVPACPSTPPESPLTEFPSTSVPEPAVPVGPIGCPAESNGSLVEVPEHCPEPVNIPETTTTTAPPPTTAPPETTPTTAAPETTSTAPSNPQPEVLGIQVEPGALPTTPVATAVPANPSYTG